MELIREIGEKHQDYVVAARRRFHQNPELSGEEYETCRMVLAELESMGIQGKIVADTGVMASVGAGKGGKTVALRADMDALCIQEETGLPYASKCEGKMHACGHDAHMAMLLGAAKILKELEDKLPGEVRFLFQPAEESNFGATRMIEAGCLEGVDSVFGMHVWSDVPAGQISVEAGPKMACADFFTIDIEGASCHASRPDQGVDAITAGAALVNSLQAIVSRETSPLEPVVITVGEFNAGVRKNVVAERAHLTGTVRVFSDKVRDQVEAAMERVARATGDTYRVKVTFEYERGCSVLVNDPACAAIAEKAALKVLGDNALYYYGKSTGGEDFGEYLSVVPGAFGFLGVGNAACGAVYPQHSCHYVIDESALIGGSMVAAQYAMDFLTKE